MTLCYVLFVRLLWRNEWWGILSALIAFGREKATLWHNKILSPDDGYIKFVFSKKATKNDEMFTVDLTLLHYVKSTVKISSIFVAFLENRNFTTKCGQIFSESVFKFLYSFHCTRYFLDFWQIRNFRKVLVKKIVKLLRFRQFWWPS